jgi:hypothetical protein
MTRKLIIMIITCFLIFILIIFGSIWGINYYKKWLAYADPLPSSNSVVKSVQYIDAGSIVFAIGWKKELKPSSALNIYNYSVEPVIPIKGKWLPTVARRIKKCNIFFVNYGVSKYSYDKNKKFSLLYVKSSEVSENNYYRVTVRNLEFLDGEKMDHEEYGVTHRPIIQYNQR